jgi:hypothetical protein
MGQPAPNTTLPARIGVEEFTEVTFNAVLRAIEAQKFPRGPIIYGIIYVPEGLPGEVVQPPRPESPG